MKKVLVTGGCGIIGSRVAISLSRTCEVDVVDDLSSGDLVNLGSPSDFRTCHVDFLSNLPEESRHEKILAITGDFTHNKIIEKILKSDYDAVVHLARKNSSKNPLQKFENNVFKSVALIDACQKSNTKIVMNRTVEDQGGDLEYLNLDHVDQLFLKEDLNIGIVSHTSFDIIEQSNVDGYIEDVVYANTSLALNNFHRREFTIR